MKGAHAGVIHACATEVAAVFVNVDRCAKMLYTYD